MKKILAIILMLALVLCAVPAAFAEDPTPIMEVFNCSEYVSLREKPDTKSKVLKKVHKGELVYFYAEPDGSAESFYQVEYDGKVGYVLSKYLKGTDINKNSSIMPNQQLCNCTDGVYLRAEPDDGASHLVKVPAGAIVTRCIGGNSTWVQCTYKSKTGYIKQKYLKKADYDKKKREEEENNYPKEPIDCMQVVNTSDWLALREGPGTDYKRIAEIPVNAYVTDCLYVNAHWVHVTYEGQTGYAYTKYLTKAMRPVEKHVGFSELASLPSYYSFKKVGEEILDVKTGSYHIAVRRAYTDHSEQLLAVCYDFVEKPLWTAFEEHEGTEQLSTAAFLAGTVENPQLIVYNGDKGFTARAINEKGSLLWFNDCANKGTARENVLPFGNLIAAADGDGTIYAIGSFDEAPVAIDVNGNLLWSGINPDPEFVMNPYEMTMTGEGLVVLYGAEGQCFSVTYDFGNGACIGFAPVAAPEQEILG